VIDTARNALIHFGRAIKTWCAAWRARVLVMTPRTTNTLPALPPLRARLAHIHCVWVISRARNQRPVLVVLYHARAVGRGSARLASPSPSSTAGHAKEWAKPLLVLLRDSPWDEFCEIISEKLYTHSMVAIRVTCEGVEVAENAQGVVDTATRGPKARKSHGRAKSPRCVYIMLNANVVVLYTPDSIALGGLVAVNPEVELGIRVAVAFVTMLIVVDSHTLQINLLGQVPIQEGPLAIVHVAADGHTDSQHFLFAPIA